MHAGRADKGEQMKFQDYYKTLNITRDASEEDIKKAYKQQAKRYHPDINKSAGAEEKFKQINEAYDVLHDPERKKLYDIYGQSWRDAQAQQANQAHSSTSGNRTSNQWNQDGSSRTFRFSSNGDFSEAEEWTDLFRDFFSGKAGSGQAQQTPQKQEFELFLPLRDIAQGTTRSITLQSRTQDSSGRSIPTSRTLNVKIPQGMTEGSVLRLKDRDENGRENEILLRIRINDDPLFQVNGFDLITRVAISPWEAALGGKIEVQTIQGKIHVTVPKNAQNGKKLRLRGKGLNKRDGKTGDMFVILEIQMPTHLTKKEEELFKNLAAASTFAPRTGGKGQQAGTERVE